MTDHLVEFRCTACGRIQEGYNNLRLCLYCSGGILVRWPLSKDTLIQWFGGIAMIRSWLREAAGEELVRRSLRDRITDIFRPWFIRQQGQVLFPKCELDNIVSDILIIIGSENN